MSEDKGYNFIAMNCASKLCCTDILSVRRLAQVGSPIYKLKGEMHGRHI